MSLGELSEKSDQAEEFTPEEMEPVGSSPLQVPTSPVAISEPPKSKKKLIIICLAIILLAIGAGAAYLLLKPEEKQQAVQTTGANEPAKLKAIVSIVDGTAEYSSDGLTWQPLKGEETISEGQFVRTDSVSRVVLVLDDGSIVRLNNSSEAKLVSMLPNDIKVENASGEVYARVVTSDRKFTVIAAETEYVAKGTAYKTVNSDTLKGVVVYQSSVDVSETEEDVAEGKRYYQEHPSPDVKSKITDLPVDELKADAFAKWNLDLDKQTSEFKDKLGYLTKIEESVATTPVAPSPVPAGASITLSASPNDKGIFFSWQTSGLNTKDGFKLVRSKKSQTPTYGSDSSDYVSGESTRDYTLKIKDGGTYYFRICVYRGNTCEPYSNTVQATAPYIAPEVVGAGVVTLAASGNTVSWTFTGTAPHGFKILVASSPSPSYPNNSKFFVDKNTLSQDVSAKLVSGDNYVKVCKYTADSNVSSGCTDYSNEVIINKP